jgi:hypothetical protein
MTKTEEGLFIVLAKNGTAQIVRTTAQLEEMILKGLIDISSVKIYETRREIVPEKKMKPYVEFSKRYAKKRTTTLGNDEGEGLTL